MATIIGPVKASVTLDLTAAEKQLASLQQKAERLPAVGQPAKGQPQPQGQGRRAEIQAKLKAPTTVATRRADTDTSPRAPRGSQVQEEYVRRLLRSVGLLRDVPIAGPRSLARGTALLPPGGVKAGLATALGKTGITLAIAAAAAKTIGTAGPFIGGYFQRIGEEFGIQELMDFGKGAGDAQRTISTAFEIAKTPWRVGKATMQGIDLASARVIAGSSEAAATEDLGAFVRASAGEEYLKGMMERTKSRVTVEAKGRMAADGLIRLFDKVFNRP